MKVPKPDPQTAIPVAKARFFSKYIDTLTMAGKYIKPNPKPGKQNYYINRRWEKQNSCINRRRPIQLCTFDHKKTTGVMQEKEGYHQPHENSCIAAEGAVDITAGKVRWQNKVYFFCTFSWK